MDEEFESFVVTDPDIVDPGIDISGLRTQTDTSLLGNIPDYAGIQYEAFNPNRLSDLMRLYSSGLPAIDTSTAAPPATGGGGSGDGGQETLPGFESPIPEPTTGGGITNVDTPLTQMVTDPVTGQTQTVRQAMTSDAAYRGTTSDPFLTSGAAGGARLPTTPTDTGIMVEDFSEPFVDERGITGQRVSYPGDQSGVIKDAVDPQPVRTILGPDGITYDAVTGQPIVDDPTTRLPQLGSVTEEDLVDNRNLLQKLGLPADFDLKQAAIEAGINLAVGVPISLIAKGLEAVLPDRDPRQTALEGLYDVKDGTIQSGLMTGYNPVSGNPLDPTYGLQEAYQDRIDTIENTLKTKYNMTDAEIADVKAGSYTGDVDTNLFETLTDLEDAKEKEKNVLDLYSGDIDERDQMLEDIVLQNKIDEGIQASDDDKGDDMLDTTTGVNPFADIDTGVGEFDTTPVTGVTRPGTGTVLGKPDIEKFDDAEASIDMFDTTPVDTTVTGTLGPPSEISGPQITEEKPVDTKPADDRAVDELSYDQIIEYENLTNKLEGEEIQKTGNPDISISKQEEIKNKAIDQIKEQDLDEFSDEAFMVGDTSTAAPTTGDSGADSFFDAVDKSVTGTTKPGTKTEPTYQDAIMRGQTGGGSDSGGSSNGGGKIVCTMMNESYGFGSFRNKIWMKFHKDLSPEYQRGYHKLFLPLVKIAKKNMVVKKILEHIAVHSTIDMRQSMRGKTHLLGRIYRKILLPLCYWVGKNG